MPAADLLPLPHPSPPPGRCLARRGRRVHETYPSALPRPTPGRPSDARPWNRAAARGFRRPRQRGRHARSADHRSPPRRERRAMGARAEAAPAPALARPLPPPPRAPTGSPRPPPPPPSGPRRCRLAATRGREVGGYARGARQPEERTALPAARRQPEPHTGEQLELELVGGSAVPRPARSRDAARASEAGEAARPAAPPEPAATVVPPPTVRRGPGRPPKVPAALALPPGLKARGGRRRGTPAPR